MKKIIIGLFVFASVLFISQSADASILSDLMAQIKSLKTEISSLKSSQTASVADSTTLAVDLKINGSDNPTPVDWGSEVDVSWTVIGEGRITCIPTFHDMGGWTKSTIITSTSGHKALLARILTHDYVPTSYTIGLACRNSLGVYFKDALNLPINKVAIVPDTTIKNPSITVTSPNGGGTYKPGDRINVKWESTDISPVDRVYVYITDGNLKSPVQTVFNSGSTIYTIPTYFSPGTNYTLLVTTTGSTSSDSYAADSSDTVFSIVDPATLNVEGTISVSPNPCIITKDKSFCYSNFSVDIENKKANISYIKKGSNSVGSTTQTAGAFSVMITHGTATYDLVNNGVKLDSEVVTGQCAEGTSWEVYKCVEDTSTEMKGKITANKDTCTIQKDQKFCYLKFAIDVENKEETQSLIKRDSENSASTPSNHSYLDLSVTHGDHIFYLINAGKVLDTEEVTGECVAGTVPDGGKCVEDVTATPSISVISPNGGEVFKAGDKITVKWKTENMLDARVNVELLNSSRVVVAERTDIINASESLFELPVNMIGQYRFRINTKNYGTINDISDNYFTINSNSPVNICSSNTLTQRLSKGMSGVQVESLQLILNHLGYLNDSEVDGSFGTNTQQAVIAFQRANGLVADGIVGYNARIKINNRWMAVCGETITTSVVTPGEPIFVPPSSLSSSQINAIIGLLQSFGADADTIEKVKISLEGGILQ